MTVAPVRIWAPETKHVDVCDADGLPLLRTTPAPGGWHVAERALPPGKPYYVALDGTDLIPDPRAEEARSALGPSVAIDHDAFAWEDADWHGRSLAGAVLYELHVGTFTPDGTLDSAIARLPHLASLGVTHVELMPLATFSGDRGWGYDGAAVYAPHPAYGGPLALKRFVQAAHREGLAVVLDVVFNHLGPVGNFLDQLGPYFVDGDTPWGRALNFDGPGCDEVRRFFLDAAVAWIEHYHLDGLRLDAVHAIHDASERPFLEQLAEEVSALGERVGRTIVVVAESDENDPRLIQARDRFGLGMDAMWNDDFHHALHVALTGERFGYYADFADDPIGHLVTAIAHGWSYRGQRSEYRGRDHGHPIGGVSLTRVIRYAQNHDQIGNRPQGDRLASLVSPQAARVALALTLLAPGVPLLFMGEEWAARTPFLYFTDHRDRELARAVTEGRAKELRRMGHEAEGVDPQSPEAFLRSKLDWSETDRPEHAATLELVRSLIALRRDRPELAEGGVEVTRSGSVVRMERGTIILYARLDADPTPSHVEAPPARVLASSGAFATAPGGFVLGPHALVVLERTP